MNIYKESINNSVDCPTCNTPNDEFSDECVYCGNKLDFTGVFDYE